MPIYIYDENYQQKKNKINRRPGLDLLLQVQGFNSYLAFLVTTLVYSVMFN